MPLSISATVGRIVLTSPIGLAPGGAGTSGRSGMAKCLALIFEASIELRYSMKSLALFGCLLPFRMADGAMISTEPSVGYDVASGLPREALNSVEPSAPAATRRSPDV